MVRSYGFQVGLPESVSGKNTNDATFIFQPPNQNLRTLTQVIANALIDKIYIYSGQAIEIVWKFKDEYKVIRQYFLYSFGII